MEDWLDSLLSEPSRYVHSSKELTPHLNELISRICSKLSLSTEIAVTCFVNVEKFFTIYFEKLEKFIANCNETPESHLWKEALAEDERPVTVFLMNLVLLCAKYMDNTILIPMKIFLKLLLITGRPCSLDYLKEMELRVFQIVDYKIHPPVAYYCAMYFLERCFQPTSVNHSTISGICKELLRISFLRKHKIFTRNCFGTVSPKGEYQIDQVLLASAVVLTTFSMLKFPERMMNNYLDLLSVIGRLPPSEIALLASRIESTVYGVKMFSPSANIKK